MRIQRIAVMLTAAVATANVIAQTKESEPTRNYEDQWKRLLSQVSKTEDITVLFDLNEFVRPPDLPASKGGELTMRLLAATSVREWRNVDNVQLFVRRYPGRPGSAPTSAQVLLGWLTGLSADELRNLLNGNFYADTLPESLRARILECFAFEAGFASAVANSEAGIRMRLMFCPAIEYTDPKTGRKAVRPLHLEYDRMHEHKPSSRHASVARLPKPHEGPLNYEDGDVMTLARLIEDAERVFKDTYYIDGRLRSSRVFVRGSFTKASFDAALKELTTVAPAEPATLVPAPHEAVIKDLMMGPLSALLTSPQATAVPGIDPSDYLNDKAIRLSTLEAAAPEIAQFLKARSGLSDGSQVRLRVGLYLTADAGGTRPSGVVSRNLYGDPIPVGIRNVIGVPIF